MCVPILRSIGTHIDEFRKHAKIMFYLTSRDTETVRRTSWGLDASIRNNLKPTRSLYDFRFKSYGSNCGFHDFGDILILTFDLLFYMFYFVSHALGMKYWHLHAKFHKNRSSINW